MLFGLFMLWWGWIGFNCGSTFGISGDKWLVAARAGVNTINASAAGGVAAMWYSKRKSSGQFIHPADVVNGILGALVASSPTCAAVHTYDSLAIGAVGAVLACWINDTVMKQWFQLDDPVGAMGVHAGGGLWGCLAVALFADADLPGIELFASGLFRGGGLTMMGQQLVGMSAITAWSLCTMTPFFYLMGVICHGGSWSNPRAGLRYEYDQMDPHLHGCSEDPTELIEKEITKALTVVKRELRREVGDRNLPLLIPPSPLTHQGVNSLRTMVSTTVAEEDGSSSSTQPMVKDEEDAEAPSSSSA